MPAAQQSQSQLSLERARVRDLLRYYKPNLKRSREGVSNGSLLEICDEPHSISDPHPPTVAVAAEAADDAPDDSQLLSHDPTLTAFAQLGAFRLNCQRSFISLMDHENQYILAEATRSVSLNDQTVSDEGDEVYLGARVLDMVWGVCPNTIQVFTAKDGSLNVETDLVVANQQCYVMSDLSAIESFRNRPYVAGWPHMRFYAEVPIHSPTGFVIGTYCVVDDKPRDSLGQKGLDALNEIASAIMKHLELIQMQHNLQRAGGMVKGLGMFVEGTSNPPQQWTNGQGSTLEGLESRPGIRRIGTAQTLSTASERRASLQETVQSAPITNGSSPGPKVTDDATVFSPAPKSSSVSDTTAHSRERKMSTNDRTITQESLASTGTKQLFSRACFLIREALDLDGILFVDAFFRDIAVDSAQSAVRSTSPESLRFRGIPDTPGNDKTEWLDGGGGATGVTTNIFSDDEAVTKRPEPKRTSSSELLGYSVQQASILGGLSPSSKHLSLPQSTLRGLLRKYRHGHTFVIDEDGSLVPDADDANEELISKPMDGTLDVESDPEKEKVWIKQLLQICPGARSIIFFPLWDPQRDQWFAGSLAWTSDPTRVIQSADVTYLAAFGSCIMSEKSRLDALTADRAKADFISSVSHELRSPLHGVLASAEALQEISTGLMQDDMIRTIIICGEALLDTMDQILDYAKTSNSANVLPQNLKHNLEPQTHKTTSLDLSNLVETVVEGIFAGHNYRKLTFGSLEGRKDSKSHESKTIASSPDDVMIILSIDWQASWIFESEKGGWKRILMNLFGNALKYTHSGFIHVSLSIKVTPITTASPAQRVVSLQIDDTGKGMSKDYLKYKLFTPFAQEDQMSVGTGLGLSIVRQLVTDLGGKIDIQSEVAYGTTVKVSVPFGSPPQLPNSMPLESSSLISDMRRRCKRLALCLIGFEYYPDIGENPTGILSTHARRMLSLKSSFTTIALDWFGMEVLTASSLDSARGDILVGLRSKIDLSEGHVQEQALIIFEDIIGRSRSRDAKGVYYLSQPAGPHKMARVLALCLDWRFSVTEPSESNNATAKSEIPTQNAVLEGISTLEIADRQSTNLRENVPVETDQPQLLPPSVSKPHDQQAEGSAADKMILTLPYNKLAAKLSPPRSKVLLVEDNAINMKILVHYMQKAKQDYVTAANGLEALQKFQADPLAFRVIFMDLSMPVMDGLASTRHIRMYEVENTIPRTRIVALTCFSSPEYQRDAAVSGVDMFLIKPVPMKTLKPILDLHPDVFPEG